MLPLMFSIQNGRKPFETLIKNFYKLHMNKGKEYTFKNFKKIAVHLKVGKHLSEEFKSSKKRLIKVSSLKCLKN